MTGKKKDSGGAEAGADAAAAALAAAATPVEPKPYRRRLPAERTAITHKFDVAGHEGYITVGLYPDGQPGEIFLKMAKEGSTISGLMDTFATTVSVALQYGVPLHDLVHKFAHVRFEPSGFTSNRRSRSPSRSWTTSSAGWDLASCRPKSERTWSGRPIGFR